MKKRSTLQNYNKSKLIDIIEYLEKNNEILSQTLDQQYYNALTIIEKMNIFNSTYSNIKENVEKL